MESSNHTADDDALDRNAPAPDDPSAAAAALIGLRIAERYELMDVLGQGALGRVFRARRLSDNLHVALKLLHDRHANDAQILRRFQREIEAAGSIDHPCVVRVIDSGVDAQGRPFVCMECVEGKSLATILREEELTPRRIEALLTDILSALSAAHRKGVVHRDLKPDNVLIAKDSEGRELVKLCDFGVAKILRSESGSALTMDGMLCGSPDYMAPEQATGKNLDGRVDVYAVGVVLYLMLTRELPFQGSSPVATAALHATDPVIPPRERRPDRPVPRELEAVCLKALQKSPSRRYQSAIEMSEALRAAVKQLDGRADVPMGSATFERSLAQISTSAAPERLTIPGDAMRSRTRVWLGALLLVTASAAIAIPLLSGRDHDGVSTNPVAKPAPSDARDMPKVTAKPQALAPGERALSEGKRRLRQNDFAGAVRMLEQAADTLGERPDVLRALGEAQLKQGDKSRGIRTLTRYLQLAPQARDRVVVEALIQSAPKP